MQKGENLHREICCGGAPPFSGHIQVDAAAKVDGDKVHCSGGGARARVGVRGRRREKGRMKKDLVGSIYKEKPVKWARKTRRLKNIIIQLQRRLDFQMVIKIKIL